MKYVQKSVINSLIILIYVADKEILKTVWFPLANKLREILHRLPSF